MQVYINFFGKYKSPTNLYLLGVFWNQYRSHDVAKYI